ncbi:recombination protein RecA [Fistulifera solaris]|uniref:Recombination protein RecA n=1 Tax=Fistulifera solaris TaxID=1519565 RepID=A0A1Z5K1C9_FISSO|nr:recombination protein RecA [Fistulifera solaris]|eukprot:GAX19821.1 recombination protein RecA [Fistulifera solaris]
MKIPNHIVVSFLLSLCVSETSGFIAVAPPRFSLTLKAARNNTPEDSNSKSAALQSVLNQIERSYGRGSILQLGNADLPTVECLSTGALTLDMALGGQGYPKGRVVEIYGPESSGKTTLALHAIAECQKKGGTAAFIDAEHALDLSYAQALGVDASQLLLSQPDSGEMALDVCDQLIRSRAVDIVVIDSVAALVPRAELEGSMGDAQIGLQARLMSKALRKLTGSLHSSNAIVIFLNQLRQKVGVIYGSPEVTAGGNALKFYASVRLDTRRQEILPPNAGIRIKVKVVKNKVAPPFRVVNLDILFGKGIDSWGDLVSVATELGVLERKGSWYALQGNNLAQGKQNLVQILQEDEVLQEKLQSAVREAVVKNIKMGDTGSISKKSSATALSEPVGDMEDGSYAMEEEELDVF